MWVAPGPLLIAVAVFPPVAPGEAWTTSSSSIAGFDPLSNRSVIPAGGVQSFVAVRLLKLADTDATTMALAAVVVILGVDCDVLLAAGWQYWRFGGGGGFRP